MRSIEVSRDRLRAAADELALRRNAGFECDPSQHSPARPRGSTAGPSSATMNGTFCVISPRNTCAASPRAARRTPCRSRPRQIRPCERALADGKLLVRRALRLLNRGWLQSAYRCEFDGKDRCEGQKGHTKLVVGCGSFASFSTRSPDVCLTPDSGAKAEIPGPALWANSGSCSLRRLDD